MADAKVEALALVTGSRIPKDHMPQQLMRQEVEPSKPECASAEYASTCNTQNGASMGKLYNNSDNFPFVGASLSCSAHLLDVGVHNQPIKTQA
jgi:hypothetical protein